MVALPFFFFFFFFFNSRLTSFNDNQPINILTVINRARFNLILRTHPYLSINYYRSSNIATVSTNWQKCFSNSTFKSPIGLSLISESSRKTHTIDFNRDARCSSIRLMESRLPFPLISLHFCHLDFMMSN